MKIFLTFFLFAWNAYALAVCSGELSVQKAEEIVDSYRLSQAAIPSKRNDIKVTYSQNKDTCHYYYKEAPKKFKAHASIIFVISRFEGVVDVRMSRPMLPNALKCPPMNLDKDYFFQSIKKLRQTSKLKIPKLNAQYDAIDMKILRCMYVYEEFNSKRKTVMDGNTFYFDHYGEIINFSGKN